MDAVPPTTIALISALDAEIARLEGEIAADPRVARVAALKRFRDECAAPLQTGTVIPRISGVQPSAPTKARSGRIPSPERMRALDAAAAYLGGAEGLVPMAVIYEKVASAGIDLGGQNPQNNLSAMMSRDARFKAHGRAGWTLADRDAGSDNGSSNEETGAVAAPASDQP